MKKPVARPPAPPILPEGEGNKEDLSEESCKLKILMN